MAAKTKRPSPILGATGAMIGEASDRLVTKESLFRHTFEAPVERIQPDPAQPRKLFDEAEIASLAATMAERGQLQPILVRRNPDVRGHWVIVAGERRWRAALSLKWPALLAIEHDGDPEVAALIENLQRVDLTPVEEARGLQRLIEGKGWSQNAAADALGKSKGEISSTLRILTLPAEILDAVLTSELNIPKNALVELARIESPAVRERLVDLARAGLLTVRAIRAAREAEERILPPASSPPPAIREVKETRSPAVSLKAADKLVDGLRAVRASGRALSKADRERLLRLKALIEELLAGEGVGR